MTQPPPSPDRDPESQPRPRRSSRLRYVRRIVLPVGLVLTIGAGGAAVWGWRYIHNELPGVVAQNLSELLNRPVAVGEVEGVSLTGLKLGRSVIAPTPKDTDTASVETIEVGFNLFQTLWTRKLKLDIALQEADIYLEQDKEGWIATRFTPQEDEGFIEVGTIRLENSKATLLGLGTIEGKRSPVVLNDLNGKIDLFDENQRFSYEAAARSSTNGEVQIIGETLLPNQQTNLQIRANNLLVAEVDRLLNLPFDLPTGRGSGNFNVQLRPNIKTPPITGTAKLENVTLRIPAVPRPFTNARGTLQFRGNQILPENVVGTYGKATATIGGLVDLDKGYNLTANVQPIGLTEVTETLNVRLPLAFAGQVRANLQLTGPLQSPVLSGTAQSTQPGRIERVDLSRYSVTFRLDTAAEEVVIQSIQATPTAGGSITGSGRIALGQATGTGDGRPPIALNFLAINVPGDPIATAYNNGTPPAFTIGRVNAQAQISGSANNVQTFVRWSAPEASYPGVGEVQIANGVTTLRNTRLQVEGGTVNVDAIAAAGRWQGNATVAGVQLDRLSPDLRGLFSGQFTASGRLDSFQPADIRAQGTARFSQGIAVLERPLTAQLQWNGQQVIVQQATAPGFRADGTLGVRLEGTPAITALNLNVQLDDYNLREFAVRTPGNITYAGLADFAGTVTGTPNAPNVNGTLALRNFVVNQVAFEPYLAGRVQYGPGVRLDLRGQQDRIVAVLDSQFRPIAFDVQRGDAIAQGRTEGEILLTELRNLPLSLIPLPGLGAQFAAGGTLTGSFAINLNRQTVEGDLAIARPALGPYRAETFRGRITFADGIATLTGGQLQRGETTFQIGVTANLQAPGQPFQGKITIAQAQIQDILEALQIFDIQDFQRGFQPAAFGSAANLQTVPIDTTDVPIQDQIRRLAEIEKLLALVREEEDAAILPDLRELQGIFSGSIDFTGSLQTGLNANFNLQGENFQWGRFSAKEVVAIGSFENGELTLVPLRLESDETVVAFSGQLLGARQSGQLRIENLPVETIEDFVQLPVNVSGLLNATATLAGSFTNPQAVGQYRLVNGAINGTNLQQARGSFTYANARLDFSNTLALTAEEPLYIAGSIPYQLPFATVRPDSNLISLDINVSNEGLALLNLLNNQVAWLDGQGEVRLQVRGTITNPIATGTIRLENATLQATALPDPLTNVNGLARFDFDRVRVEQFSGAYGQGNILASGVLPLVSPLPPADTDVDNPLIVNLNDLRVNLKGLYQGGVAGNTIITGTALNPILSGEIQLSRGQVQLAPEETTGGSQDQGQPNQAFSAEFADLKLTLGDGVILTNPPLLQFVARGDLTINGPLNNPEPIGTIRLQSGQVNLFTTQFTLERGYPQTATFVPGRGRDPDLNVRLIALVPEVTNRRQPSVLAPSEILDVPAPASGFGSLQTVRVRAEAIGPVSRLSENLSLTSNPPRSQEEIVALIGGGFVATFGRGDTLLGLANLAGSALLSNVQTTIGNALGLSEFRLFPTYSRNNIRRGDSSSTLGLAAEAAVDVTPALSVSVLKVLTNSEAPQFGIRYRINDNLLVRSSTDFSGDNRAAIEYELRF